VAYLYPGIILRGQGVWAAGLINGIGVGGSGTFVLWTCSRGGEASGKGEGVVEVKRGNGG